MNAHENEAALSRRTFLGAALLAGGCLLVDLQALAGVPGSHHIDQPFAGGRLLKIVPFAGEAQVEAGKLFATGLDGRLYSDLSTLAPHALVTPTSNFYVRTSCSDLIDFSVPWQIKVSASPNNLLELPAEKVKSMARPMGIHLMECSGNERGGQFGLMSACHWDGVPLLRVLEYMKLSPEKDQRICVSGFDRYSKPSGTPGLLRSIAGASWIFTTDQLDKSGAFLATRMNGEPLTKDHGFPVRLVVPGWYGCTCIKWVDAISFVDENALATSQMQEFAGRTHQNGVPELACHFKPAAIDQAAMPIRVEQWEVDGTIKYNVVGIMWGGHELRHDLEIRFSPDEAYVPVESYNQKTNATWTLWSHRWSPEVAGTYSIQLRIADPTVPSKRLDKGYYVRSVRIADL